MQKNNQKQDETCAICGKSSILVCGKCKSMNYCSSDCQEKHWEQHKKTCGKPVLVDSPMVVGDKCTRCCETIEADENGNPILTGCRIPHPEHLQQTRHTSLGQYGVEIAMACQACHAKYRRTSSNYKARKSETEITRGPKFCFDGLHTSLPHNQLGDRRIRQDMVVIKAHKDMQDEIDALDGNEEVTVLRICSDGYFDSDSQPRLNVKLPNLREFQFEAASLEQIRLTKELTPNVETISMLYLFGTEDPDFVIECPRLKHFKCCSLDSGNLQWVNNMLAHATKLESFYSYMLRIPYLKFASNQLDSIRLHKANCLQYLELYAPRLTVLDVQMTSDLDDIKFVDTHPTLSANLPPNFHFNQELEVNALKASLGEDAKHAITSHERFYGELLDHDDADGDGFAGSDSLKEAMVRQMYGGGGGIAISERRVTFELPVDDDDQNDD